MEMYSLEFMHLKAGVPHQAAQKLALTFLTEVTGMSVSKLGCPSTLEPAEITSSQEY